MVERIKSKRQRARLKSIRLSELSLVDRPANPHARVVLFKRADDLDKRYGSISELPESVRGALPAAAQRQFMEVTNSALAGQASEASAFRQAWGALKNAGWRKNDAGKWVKKDYDGGYPQPEVVVQEVQALDFDDVLAEGRAREAAESVRDGVWSKWHALQQSFRTIAEDSSVEAAAKVTAMQESLRQFVASLSEESESIAESMTKAISAVPALAGLLGNRGYAEGDEPMTAAEKQQLDELQKKVEELTSKLAAATADDAAKRAADLQGELDAAKAETAELAEKIRKAEQDGEEVAAKAGMSDAEKEYMSGLSGEDKMKFMRATPADRKRMMAKSAESDPVVYKSTSTGEEFRKSDDPRLVAMAKQADEDRAIAKEEREKRETAELTKRAGESPYSHYAGEPAEKIDVLRAISGMDEGPRAALEKMLEAGGKAIAAAFDTIGHQRGEARKSASEFDKRVDEIAKRDGIPRSAAMAKAPAEYPEEFKAAYPEGNGADAAR